MKLIFEKTSPGRKGITLPELDTPDVEIDIPETSVRKELDLPELREVDVVMHYTALSKRNFGVDSGFYPLGSCTMKYNPKINEDIARLPGFSELNPMSQEENVQGAMKIMYNLEQFLCEITGMSAFTLQPAAGSHGELTGVMIMKKYFKDKGEDRRIILIPDSAHGTNPASAAMCGFSVKTINSCKEGEIDINNLKENLDKNVAGLMLTNPNTLGIFEREVMEIARILHDNGSLFYCDGANMNALLGIAKVADMGFDIMHFNLHKTFSTPHGGGGPGAGPIGVTKKLEILLPNPRIKKEGEKYCYYSNDESIGRIRAFFGNFGVIVRAYTYIKTLGAEGLREVSENAVLNANYLLAKLKDDYNLPYKRICKHEFVINDMNMPNNVTTADIAKRLLDYGFHSPTIYFPLIVHGAMMIEPTETESKQTMDEFAEAMISIKKEAEETPDVVKNSPFKTPVRRLDAVMAARNPILKFEKH